MGKNIYERKYDYDDMKIAICIQDYVDHYCKDKFFLTDFESLIKLVVEIKESWNELQKKGLLTENEFAYIQEYAYRYLKEMFGGMIK